MEAIARDMKEGTARLTIGPTIVLVAALYLTLAPPAFALPTADNVDIADSTGGQGTSVLVPVTITNVQNGPVISVLCDIRYDTSVIALISAQKSILTSSWDSPTYNNFEWGSRLSLVYDGQMAHALQNGVTGSVVLLNFSVIGEPGETSMMDLTTIQLADTGYNVGTAPAKNGTFSIRTSSKTASTHSTASTEPSARDSGENGEIAQTQPGFKALITIAGLMVVAYVLRRRKQP